MSSQRSLGPEVVDDVHPTPAGFHDYSLYGISLRSEIALAYRECPAGADADVTISVRDHRWFSDIRRELVDVDTSTSWYEYARLPDGADFLRWPTLFEFVVSADGRQVVAGHLENASAESFQSYLLGWVLSFALVKQGYEPLHATAVVVDGGAVALLGGSGGGKSTLAAAFVHAGHSLLTDDLLLIREVDGVFLGFPGPPRLKLFPQIAERFQPQKVSLGPMNPDSDKIIVALADHEVHDRCVPIHGFVVLDGASAPDEDVRLEALSAADALLALIAATFNDRLLSVDRLQRQFRVSTEWADRLPARRARYPRTLTALTAVQQAIVRDIRAETGVRS